MNITFRMKRKRFRERYSLRPILQNCNIINLFCPHHRKNSDPEPVVEKPEWQLSKKELKTICAYLNIRDEDGFLSIFPHKLHQQWDEYMLSDLFESWMLYIYGDMDNILPDLKRFSELVKGQWAGSTETKSRIIFAIISRTTYEEAENEELTLAHTDIAKHFRDLFATCLRGMGVRNNPELLMWMNCDVDMNDYKLEIVMTYFADELPDVVDLSDLRKLMSNHYILGDVLKSVIEMCFGIAPFTNRMIPFPLSSTRTILDIAEIVLLNALVGGGVDYYEWQMVYNVKHGCDWFRFQAEVVDKGPTIFLLRDREGWVFGGYASRSWKLSNKFYGTGRCFLFRLFPTFKIFRPSFTDENFMYLSYGQDTPNGLALGGDLDRFGLWINIEEPVGRCHNHCKTFLDFECLSATNNFFYVDMEVWRLFPRKNVPPTPPYGDKTEARRPTPPYGDKTEARRPTPLNGNKPEIKRS